MDEIITVRLATGTKARIACAAKRTNTEPSVWLRNLINRELADVDERVSWTAAEYAIDTHLDLIESFAKDTLDEAEDLSDSISEMEQTVVSINTVVNSIRPRCEKTHRETAAIWEKLNAIERALPAIITNNTKKAMLEIIAEEDAKEQVQPTTGPVQPANQAFNPVYYC